MDAHREVGRFTAELTLCIYDAMDRLSRLAYDLRRREPGWPVTFDEVQVESWPQSWGGGDCGFGGMAPASITRAQAVLITDHRSTMAAVVYHRLQFAYLIEHPNEAFYEAVRRRFLMGAADYKRKGGYEREQSTDRAAAPKGRKNDE